MTAPIDPQTTDFHSKFLNWKATALASRKKSASRLESLVGTTLKQFLDRAEQISNDRLARGQNAGSLLTIQAGNEMTMVSQTIRTEFGNEMDKQVASVSA